MLALTIGLTILIPITVPANESESDYDLPQLNLPAPPEAQEGDSEMVETTVGAMRSALYYYEVLPIVIDHGNEVSEIALKYAKRADSLQMDLSVCEEQKRRWRRGTYYASGAAVATALLLTLSLIK